MPVSPASGASGAPTALLLPHRLSVPDLLTAEYPSFLWKKVRRKDLPEDMAIIAARLLADANVEMEPARGMVEAATRMAFSWIIRRMIVATSRWLMRGAVISLR